MEKYLTTEILTIIVMQVFSLITLLSVNHHNLKKNREELKNALNSQLETMKLESEIRRKETNYNKSIEKKEMLLSNLYKPVINFYEQKRTHYELRNELEDYQVAGIIDEDVNILESIISPYRNIAPIEFLKKFEKEMVRKQDEDIIKFRHYSNDTELINSAFDSENEFINYVTEEALKIEKELN